MKSLSYLNRITRVIADVQVQNSTIARRVRNRLPQVPFTALDDEGSLPEFGDDELVLYLKNYRGRFWRYCPGTRYYRCCAYRIIHIGENCPLGCSYCILRAYFQDGIIKVWANQQDLFSELEEVFSSNTRLGHRMGTGEFTDSLALESLTGYSRDLVSFLQDFCNVRLELKSKIVDLSWMEAVKKPESVLPSWSLNSLEIARGNETLTAPLEKRLQAASYCARQGMRVCLHFDPVIYYPGWENGYGQVVDMIFDYLRPEHIAYLSLGSFRGMTELKNIIGREHPDTGYIYAEYVTGLDKKFRLLRPLRVKQLRFLVKRLQRYGMRDQLYLCMESDDVWRAVFGYTPKELGGLSYHLLNQALR